MYAEERNKIKNTRRKKKIKQKKIQAQQDRDPTKPRYHPP